MKIHQLPYGARFRYQGEEYVKTGPMTGSGKDGPQVFARYLVLEPLDEPVAPPPVAGGVSRAAVMKSFDAFCAECRGLFGRHPLGDDERAVFERARERFLRSLG